MKREDALGQLQDVIGVIQEQLGIAEDRCNDQLPYPIKVDIAIIAPENELTVSGETWTACANITIKGDQTL